MSCCGSKRQTFLPPPTSYSTVVSQETPVVFVKFRYNGQRSMLVTGGATSLRYRFAHPGDEVMVDQRDVPGMAAVPHVERVIEHE